MASFTSGESANSSLAFPKAAFCSIQSRYPAASTVPTAAITMYVLNTASDKIPAGLYEAKIAGNSPQNPAKPGSPKEAIAQNPKIQPILGACTKSPPSLDMSKVW